MIKRTCEICRRIFHVHARYIKARPARFCSSYCRNTFFARIPIWTKCLSCKKPVKGQKSCSKKYCSLQCYWNRLRSLYASKKERGRYIYTKTDDGRRIYVHRFLMEKKLGRKLSSKEIVHHKNGNRSDNRIANLGVISQNEHIREHFSPYQFGKETPMRIKNPNL